MGLNILVAQINCPDANASNQQGEHGEVRSGDAKSSSSSTFSCVAAPRTEHDSRKVCLDKLVQPPLLQVQRLASCYLYLAFLFHDTRFPVVGSFDGGYSPVETVDEWSRALSRFP